MCLAHSSRLSLGFTYGDKNKGVAYRVWRFEVESAVEEGLHSNDVIAEQIRNSLQGEAKHKIVAFGAGIPPEQILEQLDQFYGETGVAIGDELLTQAYKPPWQSNKKSEERGNWTVAQRRRCWQTPTSALLGRFERPDKR